MIDYNSMSLRDYFVGMKESCSENIECWELNSKGRAYQPPEEGSESGTGPWGLRPFCPGVPVAWSPTHPGGSVRKAVTLDQIFCVPPLSASLGKTYMWLMVTGVDLPTAHGVRIGLLGCLGVGRV